LSVCTKCSYILDLLYMTTLVLLLIILLIIGFFLQAGVLHFITKLFKLNQVKFTKAILVTGLLWISTLAIGLLISGIFYLVGTESFSDILIVFFGLIAFHFILQKYYKSQLGKNIAMYLLLFITSLIISIGLILPVRQFIVQPFYMSGNSMEPIAVDGEYMLFTMYNKTYEKDDIVILRSPINQSLLIRKISGLPGETIQLTDGQTVELGNDEYFVVSENTNIQTLDSYVFGAIKSSSIIGKYWLTP
jgi:signal peptidase I